MTILPENKPQKRGIIFDTIFLYGDSFTGKTTLASNFPNALILSFDGNFTHLDTPAINITNYNHANQVLKELEKGDHSFETIVVDPINLMSEMFRGEVLNMLNIEHEADKNDFGKTFAKVQVPFKDIIMRVAKLNVKYKIFLAHEKIVEERKHNIVTTKIKSALSDNLNKYVASVSSLAVRVVVAEKNKETVRSLILKANSGTFGGSRLPLKNEVISSADPNELFNLLMQEITPDNK